MTCCSRTGPPWCNPPYVLLGRILRVISQQRARAALVLPKASSRWWFNELKVDSFGVRHTLDALKLVWDWRMRDVNGKTVPTRPYKIVFLDFSGNDRHIDTTIPGAEDLPIHLPNPHNDPSASMHINMLPQRLVNDALASVPSLTR